VAVTLARVAEDIGESVLCPAFDGQDLSVAVDGLALFDSEDLAAWPHRALVLGVGVGADRVPEFLETVARRVDGGSVVIRARAWAEEFAQDARDLGVRVLLCPAELSWMQLAATLTPVLSGRSGQGQPATLLGGVPSGDLFALANALAEILDAPVTVEDRESRVLAFSIRQEEADPSRIGAILNRQVTPWATQDLLERGIFRDLYRTDEPLFVEPPVSGYGGFTMPRVVLGIRAGDEILGSVWAAVPEPLSDERMRSFRELQQAVAVHMLSHRANANVERRLRADLTGQLLAGGPAADEAAARLGLPRRPAVVMALGLPESIATEPQTHAAMTAELLRLGDALDVHLSSSQPGASAALLGDVVYGIVPVAEADDAAAERVWRLATDFLTRIGRRSTAVIGVGGVVERAVDLAKTRDEADRALRVARSPRSEQRVYSTVEHAFEVLLTEIADIVAARQLKPTAPLARLIDHDERHHGDLVPTLRAWLDHFGDNINAAGSVHVHPNTFRYRLKRVSEVSGLDLDDNDVRLSLMLQFRLLL
jgi:sugar diacid utilization regulator